MDGTVGFPYELRAARRALGLTQGAVARVCDVSQGYISLVERGEAPQALVSRVRLALDAFAANAGVSDVFGNERRKRHNARAALRYAVRSGRLSRPRSCGRCGRVTPKIHGHHPDYDRPLEVLWLCVRCHADEHRAPAETVDRVGDATPVAP